MTRTLGEAIERYGVDVQPHLDRETVIPVLGGLQAQGDVIVVPVGERSPGGRFLRSRPPERVLVPPEGIPLAGGQFSHVILADGPVHYEHDIQPMPATRVGYLSVPAGSVAYLAHPEHAYSGIGPGLYEVRRQREGVVRVSQVQD